MTLESKEIDDQKFASIIDGTWRGANYWIICPFHDDTHESLKIFPTIERASFCWACGKFAWWDEVIAKVKNISISEAKALLGDTRTGERTREEGRRVIYHNFCDEYPEYDLSYIFSLTKPLPDNAREWLKKKGILDNALRLQWRWVDGEIKGWTTGIVIPYFEDATVAYMRFRKQNMNGGFDKPIGPKSISPRPYYLWGDYSDICYITEGESDAATIKREHTSVIGIPGATQIQCINSSIAECANRGIKNVVIVGDNDDAGRAFVERVKSSVLYLSTIDASTMHIPAEYNDVNDYQITGKLVVVGGTPTQKFKESMVETMVRIFGPGVERVEYEG